MVPLTMTARQAFRIRQSGLAMRIQHSFVYAAHTLATPYIVEILIWFPATL